jgi:hypothetical protein
MVLGMGRSGMRRAAVAGLMMWMLATPFALSSGNRETVEELKARVAHTGVADRPPLCLRIAEMQLDAARNFYLAGENEKAQSTLADVIAFAELDRDSAIQSHKHEKQSEIAIRKMARKLGDMKHTVSREDQEQMQKAIDRLEQVRDDLLAAMFPGGKK